MKIAGVIVCRKGSKRIINKSFKKISNVNLLENKILQLKKVKLLDKIYIGTNDLKLKKLSKKHNVNFIVRPDKYCNEKISSANDMIKNMLSYLEEDIIVWAHITNPFINHNHYTKAIKEFLNRKKNFDSLFSVSVLKNHYWDQNKKPINHNPVGKKHIPAKKLKPIFSQNGGIFIRERKKMIRDGRFIGKKPLMFKMSEITGWDLDYPWQLEVARALVKHGYAK